ncbi:MAG: class I tRNA ligase family protein, partial [Clostridiaceae bacterium]|nr:class I tRNA ligase family protein [Clostridiaceae bacterium]
YDFIWEEFCDWYIEMVKPRLWDDGDTTKAAAIWTLKTVLINSLKLLHPYMPFITEEIFCNLQDAEESIMISEWPVFKEEWNFNSEETAVETIKEAVRAIRNVRSSMNVPPSKKAKVYVVSEKQDILDIFEHSKVFFAMLGYASDVCLQKDKDGIAEDAVSAVIPQAAIYMPFAELVDIGKEIERLEKEEERLNKELARVNGMLNNERFVSKAPEAKIAEEREKLEKYTQMMEQVKERLSQLR